MAVVKIIRRTIAQPADGKDFRVTVSPPMPDGNYSVRQQVVQGDTVPAFEQVDADRTDAEFHILTTAALGNGDVVEFTLVKP